jgi:hypothetical protein
MLPTAELSDHVTPVFVEPATLAVNCWVWRAVRLTLDGETVTDTGVRVIVALADFVLSATEVAVAVIVCWLAIVLGAV